MKALSVFIMKRHAFDSDHKSDLIAAMLKEGWALEFASPELQADRDVVLTAVKKTGEALRYARRFCGDYEVAFAAAQNCGLVLALLEPDVQDAALVLAAIRQDARAMDFVEPRLRPAVQEALGLPYSPWGATGATAPNGPETTWSEARSSHLMLKPHFDQLGLPETASVEEIRQSFRRLALRHHPDKNSEDVGKATETFRVKPVALAARFR
ncbi:Chaperone protein DnaJ [Symbiodinium microadriaticum]|uniref:Chaperone protein DnaJ n=1 Tax=Symbiodinium microadriaticum TaxID=2951 RepID=A0A1Q9E6I8_SYMMI|nr:Chaperone protein DnaJ [Symbiodinium microadriaticum]